MVVAQNQHDTKWPNVVGVVISTCLLSQTFVCIRNEEENISLRLTKRTSEFVLIAECHPPLGHV